MPIWNWDRKTWREMSRFTRFVGAIILILSLPFIIPYALLINYFRDVYLCSGLEDCKVWGSDFLYSILYGLTGGLLIWYLILKYINLFVYRNQKKSRANIFIIFFLLTVAVIGVVIGFTIYTRTTKDYLEISDPLYFGLTSVRLKYDEISGVGKKFQNFYIGNIQRQQGLCRITPYIVLKDQSVILLRGAIGDHSFIEYLRNQGISPSIGGDYNCY